MGFEHLEQRTASAAMAHIGNADVVLGTQPLRGIFDNAYALSEMAFGAASLRPTFTCKTSEIPSDPVGLGLDRSGVEYRVVEHQPDGTGLSTLILERV